MFRETEPTDSSSLDVSVDISADSISNTESAPNKNTINIYSTQTDSTEMNYSTIEDLLEREKQYNKSEQWTKLDKTVKIQKLRQFADKYGKTNNYSAKDIKTMKLFFADCLEKNKLNKTKDVHYDKVKQEITSIPALHFNQSTRNFTLKIIDTKRVSTIKSLTPKTERITSTNPPPPISHEGQEK